MLRRLLLAASDSKVLRHISMKWSIARPFSRRFVAGETIEDALSVASHLNEKGLMVSLDHLGESVQSKEEAEAAADACLEMLDAIKEQDLVANISIKLTQLGLDIDKRLAERLVKKIAKRAAKHKNTVRIDMEGSAYTQRTLDLYQRIHTKHPNIGVVIQSYLMRSEQDVRDLVPLGASIRLCKGAYDEPKEIAFEDKRMSDHNFIFLAGILFSENALKKGVYPCIATHDEKIIDVVKQEVKQQKVSSKKFEFQMLYGIRPALQRSLVEEGFRVRVYVPYGTQWYPYFIRRLAERPANLFFLFKNLFRQ